MTKSRILLLAIVLFIPSVATAQTSAANKSWSAFWTRFSAAVLNKDRSAIRGMARKGFGTECANISVNEWMRNLDSRRLWGQVQRSVSGGTHSYNGIGKVPGRVTRDDFLIFGYSNGRWYFWCIMGD